MIKSWSYSKLLDAEQCMLRVKYKHIDHIPEAKAPAAERGTQIHQMAEDYVSGKLKKLPPELRHFATEFDVLKHAFKSNNVSLEGEWGFDAEWLPTAYKTAWLRMKGDAILFQGNAAVVVDYKTGQSYGNEIKHGEQCLLYAIATFIRYPELDSITVELWYLDKDELTQKTYTRFEAMRYVQTFTKRANKLVGATEFPPNANWITCKWCSFGPAKGGQCPYGVTPGVMPTNTIGDYRKKFG